MAAGAGHRGWFATLVLVALLVGAGLRLRGLEAEGLWLDEAVSVEWAHMDAVSLVRATMADVHPPLYGLLLRGWTRAFGSSDAAVRALSAVLGLLGLVLVALAGRRLWDDESGGWAALLLACSPYHVYYSQEARSYALFVVLAVASWLTLLHLARRGVAGYVACTTLLLYTHAYALFVVLAQAIWVATVRHRVPGLHARALSAAKWLALLYLPWAFVLARQTRDVVATYWIDRPGGAEAWMAAVQYAGSPGLVVLMMVLVASAVVLGRGAPAAEDPPAPRRLLALWLVTPHVLPFLASQVVQPMYLARAGIAALPALALLVAAPWARARGVQRALLAACCAVSVVVLVQYRAVGTREQWREAGAWLSAGAAAGDLVVVDRGYGAVALRRYARPDLVLLPLGHDAGTEPGAREITAALDGRRQVWVVRFHYLPDHDAVRRGVPATFGLVDYQALRGLALYRFVRRS